MTRSSNVTVADLGLGNLHSVVEALRRTGANVALRDDPNAIREADRLVVPGQGGFASCADRLEAGFADAICEWLELERPYLGICLGMQMLFESSEEAPGRFGLGIFAGTVKRLPVEVGGESIKVPHIGWKPLIDPAHRYLEGGGWYYFVHSYACVPNSTRIVVARARHGTEARGEDFCAAVSIGSVFACQFHPEKSQHRGASLLSRFMES